MTIDNKLIHFYCNNYLYNKKSSNSNTLFILFVNIINIVNIKPIVSLKHKC